MANIPTVAVAKTAHCSVAHSFQKQPRTQTHLGGGEGTRSRAAQPQGLRRRGGKSLRARPVRPSRAPTAPRRLPQLLARAVPAGVAQGTQTSRPVPAQPSGRSGGLGGTPAPRHPPVHGREDLPAEREEAQPHQRQGHRPQPRRELVVGEGWSEGRPGGSGRSRSCTRAPGEKGPAAPRARPGRTHFGFQLLLLPVDLQAEGLDAPVEQEAVGAQLEQDGEQGPQAGGPGWRRAGLLSAGGSASPAPAARRGAHRAPRARAGGKRAAPSASPRQEPACCFMGTPTPQHPTERDPCTPAPYGQGPPCPSIPRAGAPAPHG